MTQQRFPFPPFEPLTRLQVQDSLRINAERWLLAHNYHRQRQSIHYQSLWEPGIVCGLGVKAIAPPETVAGQFKDGRWIEIQPGLAIDMSGNPIVVDAAADRTYRIAVPPPVEGTATVYVVLRYVDPDYLELPERGDRVVEQFRFDQRVNTLDARDIELCRIQLAPEETAQPFRLQQPRDPFAPHPYEIDLRYRQQAQLRPQAWLTLGTLSPLSHQMQQHWQALLAALPYLCPSLKGTLDTHPIDLITASSLSNYTLLYITEQTLQQWQSEDRRQDWHILEQYLQAGGGLFVEAQKPSSTLQAILHRLTRKAGIQPLPKRHPIKTQPFHFGRLPETPLGPIEVLYGQGILLVNQPLSPLWDSENAPRHEIRTAQELGINLLYFAWQRYHFQQLLS